MQELGLTPLYGGALGQEARSALPHSPVVPDADFTPGPLRLFAAAALRRLATRLDHGRRPRFDYGRPGSVANH
jgi:hypothetical protein